MLHRLDTPISTGLDSGCPNPIRLILVIAKSYQKPLQIQHQKVRQHRIQTQN